MTAKRIAVVCFWCWIVCFVIAVAAHSMEQEIPLPTGLFFWGIFTPFFYNWARGRTQSEDEALFLRELADLLRLGIPLAEAVQILARTRRRTFGHKFSELTSRIGQVNAKMERGDTFSEALQSTSGLPTTWPDLFSRVENTDQLAGLMEGLASSYTARVSLPFLSMLRLQIIIPLVAGVTSFLTIYIMPTFVELFKGMNLSLPVSTRLLLTCSESYSLVWEIPLGLVLLLLLSSSGSERARGYLWRGLFCVPWFGRLVVLHCQSQVYRVMATGLRVGAPLWSCFESAADIVSVPKYKGFLFSLKDKDSLSVSEAFSTRPQLFDRELIWLLEQGEQLEDLPEALLTAAELCERKLEDLSKRLAVTLDVALICLLGAVITFIVVSVWLPLYQMIGTLGV